MCLVRPIGQKFLAEISLDDCPFKQFLDQPDGPVQEVFDHGAWIVGITLGHVWQQAQNAVAFDMGHVMNGGWSTKAVRTGTEGKPTVATTSIRRNFLSGKVIPTRQPATYGRRG